MQGHCTSVFSCGGFRLQIIFRICVVPCETIFVEISGSRWQKSNDVCPDGQVTLFRSDACALHKWCFRFAKLKVVFHGKTNNQRTVLQFLLVGASIARPRLKCRHFVRWLSFVVGDAWIATTAKWKRRALICCFTIIVYLRTEQTRKRARPYKFDEILNQVRSSKQNNICGDFRVSVAPEISRQYLSVCSQTPPFMP